MRHVIPLFWLGLLLLVAAACATTPEPPPIVECPVPEPVEVLADGWQFTTDPDDAGLAAAWYAPDHDRTDWADRRAGLAWEQTGLEYDGIAWYAQAITWDGDEAYLFLADADDSATVWVDGVETLALGSDNPSAVLTLDDADGEALVVIRVADEGGFGGLKATPRLAGSFKASLDEMRLIAWLEAQDPALPPAPDGGAWTMIGGVAEAAESLIANDGSLSPYATAPAAQVWLRNSATGETVNPFAAGSFSLIDNQPLVQIGGEAQGGVGSRSVAFYDETDRAIRWQLALEREAGASFDELVVAARPFRVNRTLAAFCNPVLAGDNQLWLNNAPYLAAATPPDELATGETWAGLVYRLDEGATMLAFALPAAPERPMPDPAADFDGRLAEAQVAWAERAGRAVISVPDGAVQAALDASLGYLLLASDPDGPHPGPLAHDAVWTRDAAYMGLALLMRGHEETVGTYVDAIFAGQEPDGRVPPIQGEAIPWDNDEWDAQGQAIFLAMQLYRYTGDAAYLEAIYPQMALAADYLITLRAQTANDDGPTRGLLPRSLSAEDLADGEQHYYWDNFWAINGLLQAADAADLLNTGDGGRWRTEAGALRTAVDESVAALMGEPVPYIPASVETLDNSGMARGTSPVLHPYPIVSPDDPLIRRAFDTYAERWITPYDGGYLHREGQFWTYGGIELANAYLRLDRGDLVHQILAWTLTHQTLPGVYAWAEQVDPNDFSFSGGDMPHAWMASSFTILIRNMLVLEQALGPDDDSLTLFQTAPDWWLEGERSVRVENLPTPYGPLSLETGGDLRMEDGRWVGTLELRLEGAEPPGGFRWELPFTPATVGSDNGVAMDGSWLLLPGPGTVTLTFD